MLNRTLINNLLAKEEISRVIKKHFELNETKIAT